MKRFLPRAASFRPVKAWPEAQGLPSLSLPSILLPHSQTRIFWTLSTFWVHHEAQARLLAHRRKIRAEF
jgi:hypothetical protein